MSEKLSYLVERQELMKELKYLEFYLKFMCNDNKRRNYVNTIIFDLRKEIKMIDVKIHEIESRENPERLYWFILEE